MDKDLKYRAICPLCGKSFDSRDGKLSPDGKVVCHECYEHFGFGAYIWTAYEGYNADNTDKQPEAEDFEKNQYPEFIPKDWSECYKLPLHLDDYCVYAWDADDETALSNFNLKYDEEGNYLYGERERIKHIIDVINGDCSSDFESEWDISNDEPCKITYKGKQQFLVRGWGHLTGCGGLNLPEKLASEMQDGFIDYILDRLNGK